MLRFLENYDFTYGLNILPRDTFVVLALSHYEADCFGSDCEAYVLDGSDLVAFTVVDFQIN